MIRFFSIAIFSFTLSAGAAAAEVARFDVRIQATCYAYDSRGEHLDGYCGANASGTLFEGRVEAAFTPIGGDPKFMLAESSQNINVELASGDTVSLAVYLGLFRPAKELGRPLSLSANVQQAGVDSSDPLTLKLNNLRSFEGLLFDGPRIAQSRAGGVVVKHFLTMNLSKVKMERR